MALAAKYSDTPENLLKRELKQLTQTNSKMREVVETCLSKTLRILDAPNLSVENLASISQTLPQLMQALSKAIEITSKLILQQTGPEPNDDDDVRLLEDLC